MRVPAELKQREPIFRDKRERFSSSRTKSASGSWLHGISLRLVSKCLKQGTPKRH